MMEAHGKPSGRQKQLLKTGVQIDSFEKTMLSSSWIEEWQSCHEQQGVTGQHVQDWQIDLGNFCNSACVFCSPESSSRIALEQLRLGTITQMPPRAWTEDADLIKKFIEGLQQAPILRYLHFIGGETLITPAFRQILQALIDADLHHDLTIGFTTNLTVMDHNIVDLLRQFDQINLGMSIECLDRVNDYVRFGSEISRIMSIMADWLAIARQAHWLIQLRVTPTLLTVSRLHQVYEHAWTNALAVESCNFLQDPKFMRPSVLPKPYRDRARYNLQSWIDSKVMTLSTKPVVNIRDPNQVHQQLLQDAQSFVHYLEHAPDQSDLLPDLAQYLRRIDDHRGNCVVDYLPEYEELFRSAGY